MEDAIRGDSGKNKVMRLKQLAVISGKGGTGKTTIVGAFASLSDNKVIADCDVDAPDLHLILHPEVITREEFRGAKVATIDRDTCTECGACVDICRFNAIEATTPSGFKVNPARCEGCGACVFGCEQDAITLNERISGYTIVSQTRYGKMVHAELKVGEEASGKLVTVVRTTARRVAEEEGCEMILIDGSPGIGCPVIASLTGVDLALVVTEPTMSGLHDLRRVIGVAGHFGIRPAVCINKYDLNEANSNEIMAYCSREGVPVVGKIPYDAVVTKAMVAGMPVVEYSDGTVSKAIKALWRHISRTL